MSKSQRHTDVDCCIRAAVAGAKAAISSRGDKPARLKRDAFVGHHAILSKADLHARDAVLGLIARERPGAWCLTEEWVSGSRPGISRVTKASLRHLEHGGAFIIDELDGSSAFAVGHYEWSTSVAYFESLEPKAAAVCAPDIWGGLVFFAGQSVNGVETLDGNRRGALQVRNARLQDAYVLIGPDLLVDKFSALMPGIIQISNLARTTNIVNSCALGIALVSAGKANVIVEPPQRPWDLASGQALIESAGGVVLFYRMQAGQLVRVDSPVVQDYDPETRSLGFVAGPRRLAQVVLERLTKSLNTHPTGS